MINKIIIWTIGAHSYQTSNSYFLFIPQHLSLIAVSVCLWIYHKQTLIKTHQSIHSSYYYILSFIGLMTVIFSISLLIQVMITLISDSSVALVAGHNPWVKSLSLSIALGIIGMPLWIHNWALLERRIRTIGISERQSISRRIYVFGLMSLGVLSFILSASTFLFFVLRDLFDTGMSVDTLSDAKYAITIFLIVSIFLPYHWLIYKRDSRTSKFSPIPQSKNKIKNVYMLSSDNKQEAIQYFEEALGFRINLLTWVDPEAGSYNLTRKQCQLIADQISRSQGRNVLILPTESTVRIMSYD